MSNNNPQNTLLLHHAQMLADSVIKPEVIRARGYRSIEARAELKKLGFKESQCQVPTLLIPIHSVFGGVGLPHHRPDEPRRDAQGKVIKYEFPAGASMVLDVHPLIKDKVRDPGVPLVITEGVKKADAAISEGLCCIAVVGTWNWRGTNEYGGKTALPDWEGIALKDSRDHPRQVYIVFDSDVMRKEQVNKALERLGAFLTRRGANVHYVYLPSNSDGSKVGLDDYIAAGHNRDDILARATSDLRKPSTQDVSNVSSFGPYKGTQDGLWWVRPTQNGDTDVPLTNFQACIKGSVLEDDGAEVSQALDIEAIREGHTYRFTIPASQFPSMNWALEHMGPSAVVYAGMGTRDHARAAIQLMSRDHAQRRVYRHTGWREVNGRWVYLHAVGSIGSEAGAGAIEIELPESLAPMRLPEPTPDRQVLSTVIRAVLRMWDAGPDKVMIPLTCSVFRSVMGTADFTAWIEGPSGAFKTELAALGQQFFGAGFDSRHLPGAWSGTANSIEGLAFTAKDMLIVVDDYAPVGTSVEVHRLNAQVDRVVRAQGNHAGRSRMKSDGSLRPPKPPRGMLLSTGEDIPPGASLRGRLATWGVEKGAITSERLSECQADARAGLYAQAISNFLAWLSGRYEEERAKMRERVERMRAQALAEPVKHRHSRTPEITANLAVGIEAFLRFGVATGVLTRDEYATLFKRAWAALMAAESEQASYQFQANPARRFVALLRQALSMGKCHLATVEGKAPEAAEAYGWQSFASGLLSADAFRPLGDLVGWVDTDAGEVWLLPDGALSVSKRLASETGESFPISLRALGKDLSAQALLRTKDTTRGTSTIRKKIGAATQGVWNIGLQELTQDDQEHLIGTKETDITDTEPLKPSAQYQIGHDSRTSHTADAVVPMSVRGSAN